MVFYDIYFTFTQWFSFFVLFFFLSSTRVLTPPDRVREESHTAKALCNLVHMKYNSNLEKRLLRSSAQTQQVFGKNLKTHGTSWWYGLQTRLPPESSRGLKVIPMGKAKHLFPPNFQSRSSFFISNPIISCSSAAEENQILCYTSDTSRSENLTFWIKTEQCHQLCSDPECPSRI